MYWLTHCILPTTSLNELAPAGDEIAVTHHGNNNWYGHDTELSHMHWPSHKDDRRQGLLRFTSELIKFRRTAKVLKRETFLG
jgi:pullulanase/glycogen debranching enzyme